jgi:hypothetical protein
MFGNFFGSSKKSDDLRNVISTHEQASSGNLHQKHPHLQGILDKHKIDLKNVRRNSVKVGAATAVLGAFLAVPFLLGFPKHHEQPPAQTKTTGDHTQPGHSVLGPYGEPQTGGGGSGTTEGLPKGRGSVSKDGGGGVGAPSSGGGEGGTQAESKSQGHKYGRSYLAPPKRHGLHNLGLHRGEDEGKGKGKGHEGPYPEELEVRHSDKGESS